MKLTHRELAEALNARDLLNVKNMSGETQPWNKRSAGDLRRRFDKTIAFEHEMDLEDLKFPPMN